MKIDHGYKMKFIDTEFIKEAVVQDSIYLTELLLDKELQ